ncbi:hypothetical protein [Carboxylicivirga sediminis]|nr:hypothetical protein [Carboxylicivirga sediminis]
MDLPSYMLRTLIDPYSVYAHGECGSKLIRTWYEEDSSAVR